MPDVEIYRSVTIAQLVRHYEATTCPSSFKCCPTEFGESFLVVHAFHTTHVLSNRTLGILEYLDISLEIWRVRSGAEYALFTTSPIMTYQLRNSNAAVNLNTWHWTNPLAEIDGPVGSVRAGDVRLNPPVKYKCKQRKNFLTTRVAAPLRDLPNGIMNSTSVNTFKKRYDGYMAGVSCT